MKSVERFIPARFTSFDGNSTNRKCLFGFVFWSTGSSLHIWLTKWVFFLEWFAHVVVFFFTLKWFKTMLSAEQKFFLLILVWRSKVLWLAKAGANMRLFCCEVWYCLRRILHIVNSFGCVNRKDFRTHEFSIAIFVGNSARRIYHVYVRDSLNSVTNPNTPHPNPIQWSSREDFVSHCCTYFSKLGVHLWVLFGLNQRKKKWMMTL